MRRGDLVTVALQGEQGKPQPALVVQSDLFGELPAVTVLPITSTIVDAPLLRVAVQPSPHNGLGCRCLPSCRPLLLPSNCNRHEMISISI